MQDILHMLKLFILFCFLGFAFFLKAKTAAPYGSWASPIQAKNLSSSSVRIFGAREIDQFVYFAEMRPSEKGRTCLVRMHPDGVFEDLLPLEYNARTRVHEYGGGSYLNDNGVIFFSNFSDQQIYRRDVDGTMIQLTSEPNCRFADGSCYGKLLFYVMEKHGETVDNCLVVIDRDEGQVRVIAEGADFYAAPRISPDGKRLAYFCWNHPNMPWDGGELRVADVNQDGTLLNTRCMHEGEKESVCQPTWGPDGKLYYTSDRSGWWNLYREGVPLYPIDAEIGFPQWNFGQLFFAFWRDQIVFVSSQFGSDSLWLLHEGKRSLIEVPFTTISNPTVTGDHLYFVGASPTTAPVLVRYHLREKKWTPIKESMKRSFPPSTFSVPKPIEFSTANGQTAYAFYYPPHNKDFKGIKGELPPLLVLSHGGPTAHVSATFDLQIQYWTTRGFAVVDVNYGGSSGYGKAYRERLKGNWGVVDVDDCVHAALYLVDQGLVDRNRLAIAGGSAGGYTTLACLAFRDVFKAGASFFGVSDLEALALDTHKFESRYEEGLVGPYPERRDLYLERSPLHHADQINCPVILLQGAEDRIVPPAQSEKMYQSLLKRGVPTTYILFEGEQHGFRQAHNIQRSIEAQLYFFSQIFRFQLAEPIEPLTIQNFPSTKL